MNKAILILKKSLKITLWLMIGCILLLLVITGLLQIPAIQIRVAHFATVYISDKTHTKIELKKIYMHFPKSIVMEGLYLEDPQKDTLIFIGKANINIAFTSLLKNNFKIKTISLSNAVIKIRRQLNDPRFNYNFLLTAFSDTTTQSGAKKSWTLNIDKARMKNIRLNYNDLYTGVSATANLRQLQIKKTHISPGKHLVRLNLVTISKSDISYFMKNNKKNPANKKVFNPSNFNLGQITLKASDLIFTPELIKFSINKFSTIDQNKFDISKFEMNFSMSPHSFAVKDMKINTSSSSIEADLLLNFFSLKKIRQSVSITANIKQVCIDKNDLHYFIPKLSSNVFFKDIKKKATVSGQISGTMKHLKGKNVEIHMGTSSIKTDFDIAGLNDLQTASFHFPNMRIISGRKDLSMFFNHELHKDLNLPKSIKMQIVFDGAIDKFKTIMSMNSSFGLVHLTATIDEKENFNGKINLNHFDFGRLWKKSPRSGPMSLKIEANGHGLKMEKIQAEIKVEVTKMNLNQYEYHNLRLFGKIADKELEWKTNLDDANAAFEFDGLMNLNPGKQHCQFRLNLKGADLQKLHFTKENIRLRLTANGNLKINTTDNAYGKIQIDHLLMTRGNKNYEFDSLLAASFNEPETNKPEIDNSLINLRYAGSIFPASLLAELTSFINNYFPISKREKQKKPSKPQHFEFVIRLQNHPMLTDMISPQLKEFESGPIHGSYDSHKSELKLSAAIHKIAYGTNEMSDFTVDVSSDTAAINYRLSCRSLFNTHIKLDHLLVKGKLANQRIFADISSIDDNQKKKLLIRSWVVMDKTNYKITLDPKEFYLMDDRWDLAADHYVKIGKQGILIHHFYIKKAECQINVTSVNDRFKDDISIDINNFRLDDISRIVEKDTIFLKGKVDGTLLLKRVKDKYGMIADAQISNLFVHEVPIGNLVLKARNTLTEKFDIALNLSGAGNKLIANGFYIPNVGPHSLSLKIHVSSLSMQTVQALSFGKLKEATGNLSGNFAVEGSSKAPDFLGNLTFNDVHLTPTFLNSSLELKHETVFFKNNGIYFNSFTFLDKKKHPATIDGTILMTNFKNPTFALHANSTDFTLFNSTAENNKNYFGRMIVDSKIDITGPKSHPVINGRLKMKKGSHFTFAVPEKKQTADKGEDVVEFKHSGNLIPILDMKSEKEISRPTLKGLELFSIIEIDKQATLSLLIDPESSDSLVVKGEAALSLTTDRSGKMSLTGTYNLDEGSYGLTLKSIIKKKFDIESGSNIIWNGNPLDGDIAINAIYLVRTSPSDLITDQMADLSESEMNAYKQHYPFLVYLKLRGSFLNPEISFEIKLPPNEKGVLNGTIDNKLTLLNDDPSALNKQVFALLVLGRFIQENPLQTESYSVSSATRLTIGKFLSTQLNRWSSNIIPGVDLNFDVESYDEIQSGQTQGRTQVDIGLKKRLLDDRLQVQVGGIFEVEGDKARQNSASEIVSDITLEYMITKDGRYRLKGYRHNQYEGDIDGQLVETGVGLQFVRDFTKWKYLFRNPKRNSSKKNSNGTVKNQ